MKKYIKPEILTESMDAENMIATSTFNEVGSGQQFTKGKLWAEWEEEEF